MLRLLRREPLLITAAGFIGVFCAVAVGNLGATAAATLVLAVSVLAWAAGLVLATFGKILK